MWRNAHNGLWMGSSQARQNGKDETRQRRPRNVSRIESHSTAEGISGTPSSLRFTVSATTTMYVHGIAERPRAPRHPEARAQGGTVEPRLASDFFSLGPPRFDCEPLFWFKLHPGGVKCAPGLSSGMRCPRGRCPAARSGEQKKSASGRE